MGSWVVEINGYDPSIPGASSKIFAMGAGVAFSDHAYAPSGLVSWRSANQKVDVAQAGGVTLSTDNGQMVIQNQPNDVSLAGPLDGLAAWSFYLRRANLYWIGDNTWANRQLVDTAMMQQPFATLATNGSYNSTWVFQLRDPRASLNVPLQSTKFAGTNANGQGVEGEADIKGNPKPILYGLVSNISPIRVNAALLIYQIADKPASVLCVRDGGLGLTVGTARASLATLQSTSPLPGTYDTYSGTEGTFFRLGTTPVFQVTCDAQEGVAGATRTNLLTAPTDFSNAAWVKTNITVTTNNVTAPDASLQADTATRTSTAAANVRQNITKAASALPYVFSVYADALSGNFVSLGLDDGAGNRADVCFNLSTGAISLAAGVTGSFTAPSARIDHLGNGFWRLGLKATSNTATTLRALASTSSVSQAVDGTGSANSTAMGLYWGQLEQAAAETQALLTTGADQGDRTHAQIWKRVSTERCGRASGNLNAASITAADAADNNEVGFYWSTETTQLEAMNEILTSFSGYEVEAFDFTWSIGKVVAPSGTTVLDFCIVTPSSTLTAKNRAIRNMQSVRPGFAPDGAPPYRVTINWGRNYTILNEADFAGAAPQRLRDKFKLEYRSETRTNTAIWDPSTSTGPWLNAPALTINTAYQPGDDGLTAMHAGAEAQRLLDLYSANKNQYQIDFTPKPTDTLVVGQVCSLTHPQFGLSGGPLFMVVHSMLTVENELANMTVVLGFQT